MTRPVRTPKQRAIVEVVLRAADTGQFLLLEEIQALLPAEMQDYNALRWSIHLLIGNNILSRERVGNRSMLKPTSEAYLWFRAGA